MDDSDANRDEPVILDLQGLRCPLPVLQTRRALRRLAPGRSVAIRCTDPLAVIDIPNLIRETGDMLVDWASDGAASRFLIRKS